MTTQTPIFGFPVEVTSDAPGTTLREPGSLAQAVEDTLADGSLVPVLVAFGLGDALIANGFADKVLQDLDGRIPGQRIATEIITTNGSTFTTTETVLASVTADLVQGRTYKVVVDVQLASDADGDLVISRIREDDVNGDQLRDNYVTIDGGGSTARGFPVRIDAEYTAGSTGSKTFVLTGDRLSGSGDVFLEASADNPAYLYVDYIRTP